MQIENTFEVKAAPQDVFDYLLDVNRVARCVPGAELGEVVDPATFKGRVRIKVGPITVAYSGTARIVTRDEATLTAVLEAEGRETTGPGNARARSTMVVAGAESGSTVRISTDYTVAGRVAQFGRGVMEDVSRRLVGQMATCIKEELERVPAPAAVPAAESTQAGPATEKVEPASAPPAVAQAAPAAKPLNAFGLLFAVLWDRIRNLFRRRQPR